VESEDESSQSRTDMTNLRWLKWAIARHFRQKGLKVHLASIRLGNVAIDGEVEGKGWKMALEIKTPRDDITRGIGQLAEALAYGYNQVAFVVHYSFISHAPCPIPIEHKYYVDNQWY
jgi:hypothetical protein